MTTAHAIFGTRQSDPVNDLEVARAEFAKCDWWERADTPEHWPLDIEDAVRMLAMGGEFDIDEDGLKELIGRRLVPNPGRDDNGELAFDAYDLVQVAGCLHGRGQFKATPSRTDCYKHPNQILLEQAREADEVGEILAAIPNGMKILDLREVLVRMAQSETREEREKLLVLTKVILEVECGVVIK